MYGFNNLEAVIDAASEMEKTAARGDYLFGPKGLGKGIAGWEETPMGKRIISKLTTIPKSDAPYKLEKDRLTQIKDYIVKNRGEGTVLNMDVLADQGRDVCGSLSSPEILNHFSPSERTALTNKMNQAYSNFSNLAMRLEGFRK